MHPSQFDLNQLVALDALLTEKGVSAAADRVFLSQPAMSSALKRLRKTFDDELLVPVGRRMIPTQLGRELARPIHDVLLQIQGITSKRPAFDPATSDRTISLVVSDYAGTILMPEVLKRASMAAPGIKVRMLPMEHKWPEQLERGEIDFTIIPDAFSVNDFRKEVLFKDTYCCIVWSRNRLVSSRISSEQYVRMGHVVMEFSGGRIPAFDEWFLKNSGLSRKVEVTAPYFTVLPHLVVGTNRIATVHTRLAKLYAKYLPLRITPVPVDMPALTEVVLYHRYQQSDLSKTWFRKLLESAADNLPHA